MKRNDVMMVIELPKRFKGDKTKAYQAKVLQIAKSGKILAKINNWCYWVRQNDLVTLAAWDKEYSQMYAEGASLPEVKVLKEPKEVKFQKTPLFNVAEPVKHIDSGVIYYVRSILREFDACGIELEIYYMCSQGQDTKFEIFNERALTDELVKPKKYHSKPITVSAYQIMDFVKAFKNSDGSVITVEPGDYLVIEESGKRSSCKKEVFEATYEEVIEPGICPPPEEKKDTFEDEIGRMTIPIEHKEMPADIEINPLPTIAKAIPTVAEAIPTVAEAIPTIAEAIPTISEPIPTTESLIIPGSAFMPKEKPKEELENPKVEPEKPKEEPKENFKFKIGDPVQLTGADVLCTRLVIIDRKIHSMGSKFMTNQYRVKNVKLNIDNWKNEDELEYYNGWEYPLKA